MATTSGTQQDLQRAMDAMDHLYDRLETLLAADDLTPHDRFDVQGMQQQITKYRSRLESWQTRT